MLKQAYAQMEASQAQISQLKAQNDQLLEREQAYRQQLAQAAGEPAGSAPPAATPAPSMAAPQATPTKKQLERQREAEKQAMEREREMAKQAAEAEEEEDH